MRATKDCGKGRREQWLLQILPRMSVICPNRMYLAYQVAAD